MCIVCSAFVALLMNYRRLWIFVLVLFVHVVCMGDWVGLGGVRGGGGLVYVCVSGIKFYELLMLVYRPHLCLFIVMNRL